MEDMGLFYPVVSEGFSHLYSVNKLGSVRSERTGRVIKPHHNSSGYLMVSLIPDGGRNMLQKSVHRLVIEAFKPYPEARKGFGPWECNHIDHNKENNHICNLEWVTHGENILKSYREGGRDSSKCGRPAGFSIDTTTRAKMSMAKQRPVRMVYAGGDVLFGSIGELCEWEGFGFVMYRKKFERIMKHFGGQFRGFRFEMGETE